MSVDTSQLSYEGLLMLCRSSGTPMADRVTSLNTLLAVVANNQGASWLRKALADDADLDIVFLAAGSPARPALTASVSAPADPGTQSDNITTVLSVEQWFAIMRNPAAATSSRLSAISQLIANVVLISDSEAASLGVTTPVLYNQTAMVAALNALKASVQSGQA